MQALTIPSLLASFMSTVHVHDDGSSRDGCRFGSNLPASSLLASNFSLRFNCEVFCVNSLVSGLLLIDFELEEFGIRELID